MDITTGLFDHMVLQRNARGRSDAVITGNATSTGNIRATVRQKKKVIPGFAAKTIGKASGGRFTATLAALPAGGPYEVELAVGREKMTVKDVLVGDVWIAGGQSNMHGCGMLKEAAKPHPLCRAFYMDDHWDVAHDPINEIEIAVDEVHDLLRNAPAGTPRPPRNTITGTGPAVAFIQEMQRRTGVPQGIIASSHGGTSMDQWSPAKKSEGSKSLYGATLRRFEKNGGKVAGIIWYQGESDTLSPETAAAYVVKMQALVQAFRDDLRSPKLPFAGVQISRVVGWAEFGGWNAVQEAQRRLPESIDRLAMAPAIDLPLDDGIHISGAGHQRLGKRLARAMLSLLNHPKGEKLIDVGSVKIQKDPERNIATIVVEFKNVIGKLSASGRPLGFALLDDKNLNYVFDVRLDGNRAILRTDRTPADVVGKRLYYGYGNDPVCTIVDSADRSPPAFGPMIPGQ